MFTAFSFEISMGTSEITPFLDTASPCYFFFNHPISPPLAPGEHCVSHGQQPSQWISPCGPGNFTTQLLGFGGVFPPEPAESRWDMVGWSWMDGSTWVSWCRLKLPNHFSGAVFACNFGRKCLMELCYQLFRIDQLRMDPWRVVMCRTRRLVLVVGPSRCVCQEMPRNFRLTSPHIFSEIWDIGAFCCLSTAPVQHGLIHIQVYITCRQLIICGWFMYSIGSSGFTTWYPAVTYHIR